MNVALRFYLRRGAEIDWYPIGELRISGATPPTTSPPAPTTPVPTASLTISTSTLTAAGGSFTLTYASSNASTCSLASSPDLWNGSNPAIVNCNGSYSATISPTSIEQQWTFTFTATNSSGQGATSSQTLDELPPPASFAQSSNWSGYIVPSGAVVTDVSGEWTVPTLNCADTTNAGSSTWVGTGGAGSGTGDLLQTGIEDNCVDGAQEDVGWWEEYPEVYEVDFSDFPVSPGDSIEAFVYQITSDCTTDCGQWVTELEDFTTGLVGYMSTGDNAWGVGTIGGGGYTEEGTTNVTYSGGTTAEWIVEDYATGGGALVPFANYGTVDFSDLQIGGSTPDLTTGEGVEMDQYGVVVSTPSAPGAGSFSVSYSGS